MTLGMWGAVLAYALTTLSPGLMIRRFTCQKFRLLIGVIGMLPASKVAALLGQQGLLVPPGSGRVMELIELSVSLLFLVALYLLHKQVRDRSVTDLRLRLAEAGLTSSRMLMVPGPGFLALQAKSRSVAVGRTIGRTIEA